jgi:adenosylcobinamide-GDP ribazoletransferase
MSPLPPLVALAAETRLTPPGTAGANAAVRARAVPWYPAAGLAIGALLALTGALTQGLPPFLAATLVTAVWVGFTGARTLQGLADTADGYLGGHGDRRRTLAIMRDRHGGVGAVAAVVLAVLAKAVAAGCLVQQGQWAALAAAPVAGRTLTTALLATTALAPEPHDQFAFALRLDRAAVLLGALAGAAGLVLLAGTDGLAMAAAVLLLAVALRLTFKRSLGGLTHDTLGTGCEAGELAALAVVLWGAGGCF